MSPFIFLFVGQLLLNMVNTCTKEVLSRGLCAQVGLIQLFTVYKGINTLIFPEDDDLAIFNFFTILQLFERPASLKINMHEMKFTGCNVAKERLCARCWM